LCERSDCGGLRRWRRRIIAVALSHSGSSSLHFGLILLNCVSYILPDDNPIGSNSPGICFLGRLATVVFIELTKQIEYTSNA